MMAEQGSQAQRRAASIARHVTAAKGSSPSVAAADSGAPTPHHRVGNAIAPAPTHARARKGGAAGSARGQHPALPVALPVHKRAPPRRPSCQKPEPDARFANPKPYHVVMCFLLPPLLRELLKPKF